MSPALCKTIIIIVSLSGCEPERQYQLCRLPTFELLRLAHVSPSFRLSILTLRGSALSLCSTDTNVAKGNSEMSEKSSEKSEMTAVEFMQYGLQHHVAPPHLGSVKLRVRHATGVMRRQHNWSANRVKDAWYADPRISPSADEIRDIEETTGLRYAREELRTVDELIDRADALLDGSDADFYRPFLAALRAVARIAHSSRTER